MKARSEPWFFLAQAARQAPSTVPLLPFGFETRVLAQVRDVPAEDFEWVRPLFRAAFVFVTVMMLGSVLFAYISVKRSEVSREISMSDSMVSMSLSNHE